MTIRILPGDCREVLATLPAASVHCCVTSPPYYGLRDYGTAQWDGGDPACDHRMKETKRGNAAYTNGQGGSFSSNLQAWGNRDVSSNYRDTCGKCGARRIDAQLGLEPTPDAYIAEMVAVFREVRRVLRDDGTLWLNIGDSYGQNQGGGFDTNRDGGARKALAASPKVYTGVKPKDLLMMPARLALALQADGWWVRSDIIWAKPNPMPESVTDRPTSAHEHVFLLTKSAQYFYDQDAIRWAPTGRTDTVSSFGGVPGRMDEDRKGAYALDATRGRNERNVWWIATEAFPEAHFATFPTALAERCIRAGTSERGCCASCGAPWVRQTERGDLMPTRQQHDKRAYGVVIDNPDANDAGRNRARDGHRANMAYATTTTGWAPSCGCEELRCVGCDFVLDTRNAKGVPSTAADMRTLRCAIPGHEAANEVLQPNVLRGGVPHSSRPQLQAMRPDVSPQINADPPLLEAMRGKVGSEASAEHQGLDDNAARIQADPAPRSSECGQIRVYSGTSPSDGESARAAADERGSGSSQKRRSAGQPDRELGTDAEASARRGQETAVLCDVSTLSDDVSGARKCPHCGSCAHWTTPNTVPATILDCFGGSGTVGLVADRLQRDAVLIELSPAYAAMARNRISADAGMFAEVAD